jgi:hypothetical protein
MTNPLSLLWWAISQDTMLLAVGLIIIAIVAAFVVFGGGW